MPRTVSLFALGILVASSTFSTAHGIEPAEALKKIPSTANSLAIVKIQDLVNSPLGKKEAWAKKHQTQFLAGSVHVPPSVEYLIRGFEFHPEDTRVTKSYGVAAWKQPVTMSKIADHEKSRIEMIAGHAVMLTDRDSYFAQLGPDLVGAIRPAYRQDLARWLRDVDTKTDVSLSPYLREVFAQVGNSQVVLALDFQDLVDPKSWRDRIKTSTAVVDKPNAVTLMAQLADALRGISLKVHVTDTTMAEVNLEFNTVVSQTAKPFLKPVLIDLLSEAGATLEDLTDGEVEVQNKTATIRFALSDAGLRQVMSMILMPGASESSPEPSDSPADPNVVTTGSAGQPSVTASRNYYLAVNQILEDLEALAQKSGNYNKTALWHDNFAKKIDQLSIRNVDSDVLTYGTHVASNLRGLAVSLRGVPITVNKLEHAVSYNVQYQPGGYRPYNYSIWSSVGYQPEYLNVETNQAEIRAKQAAAIAAGTKQREEIWQMLSADRQQIRIKMQEKYGQDFDARK